MVYLAFLMNGQEMEGRRKEGTFRSGSLLGRKFLFSALRTTLFFLMLILSPPVVFNARSEAPMTTLN